MSYDVFFQGFKGGDAAPGGGDTVRAMLEPYMTESEPQHAFVRIEVEDGGADVYLSNDHMMVNHAGGSATWDLLVRAAAAASWTILLPDGPAVLTTENQRSELPSELAEGAVVISGGAELLDVVASL